MNANDYYEVGTKITDVMEFIHNAVCGCDDKNCGHWQDIQDWLEDGDPHGMTMKELASEYAELTAQSE